ncbi:SDR family NAD(P)-dependent oxidoreductase [Nocardia sp. NPDC056100]|uniref:type I polyketide synthase n=1 Tax=Nocardia sp. NPDC056100 TaxID=3345712 RepID=UPI0035DDB2E2
MNDFRHGGLSRAVAIVGVSCRLPGANNPDEFWNLLKTAGIALGAPTAARAAAGGDVDDLVGGFLPQVDRFDAAFFGISPAEARLMDPQQRLLLELAWEAAEDANIPITDLRESATGVFAAAMAADYAGLVHHSGPAGLTRHTLTGLSRGALANRLSYAFGLRGASFTVDSGQSSGLTALHLACTSLAAGDTNSAFVAAVNLNLTRDGARVAERFGGVSASGRASVFDADRDGYVRGEGAVVLLLKPLDRAVAERDRIHAVIRSTAVANDGGGQSFTVPTAAGQSAVIAQALERAGIAPEDVQYVELHGTGTRAGDPIEAAALADTIGRTRTAGEPLLVGSVKSSIGHLEGAAGLAGVLKTVLSLRHRELPATLGHENPDPALDLEGSQLRVVAAGQPWPRPERSLVAGVSSFGMGGTNAHAIIEEAPAGTGEWRGRGTISQHADADAVWPFMVSARSSRALRAQGDRLADFVADRTPDLAQLSSGLIRDRVEFDSRAVVLAQDTDALVAGLRALSQRRTAAGLITGSGGRGSVGVVFGGQGSQRAGAGRQLYERFPVFRASFDESVALLDRYLGAAVDFSIRDVAFGSPGTEGLIDRTTYTQPVIFAVEVALYRLLESWGIEVAAVAGHSIGGVVAAHVAGAVSLPDAARLVAVRARLMGALPVGGAMVAVEADEPEVLAAIEAAGLSRAVAVAAVNGPRAVVISGSDSDVSVVADALSGSGRRVKRLAVSHAFHSAAMDPVLTDLEAAIAELQWSEPELIFVSDATGAPIGSAQELGPAYWSRHLRGTVRFADAVRTLRSEGVGTFLELGADAVLTPLVIAALSDPDESVATASLRRGRDEVTGLLTAAAVIHTNGNRVDWAALVDPATRIDLPTYAFQRERFWLDGPPDRALETDEAQLDRAPETGAAGPGRLPKAAHEAPGSTVYAGAVPSGLAAQAAAVRPDRIAQTGVVGTDNDRGEEGVRQNSAPRSTAVPSEQDSTTPALPQLDLAATVREVTASVLGYTDPGQVATEVTYQNLGLDSLGARELAVLLTRELGLTVAPTAVYDYPTPDALTTHLAGRLRGRSAHDSLTASGTNSVGSDTLSEAPGASGRDNEAARAADLVDGAAGDGAQRIDVRGNDARDGDTRGTDTDPIAIVAVSGRFPGGHASPEALWDLLATGGEAIADLPADRGWDLAALADVLGDGGARGGFLGEAADFDAEFFGISPREAVAMDPQQRLVLESVWELFEHAGIVAQSLRGTRTAVYLGASPSEYGPRLHEISGAAAGFGLTGTSPSVLSGRVAYTFGLAGPALTVDTACSSSLVALHLAVRALRAGEADLAIAGGVTVMAGPGMFTEFARQGGLAADGRCKAFGAAADGTGWSEAVSVVLVERLSDARRLGHEVLAVVRGTAVNQDGASNGLTAPNGPAQRQVIRAALADAGLEPSDVDVIEAHGTGTALGDPIEAQALQETYGRDRPTPVWLGSLKSNIGHTQAAAGTAGVAKTVLALRHQLIPATLHAEPASPFVDWLDGSLRPVLEPRPWPRGSRPRRAAVSSFGISGTNAHVIIEEAPAVAADESASIAAGPLPFVLSGRTPAALRAQADRLGPHISGPEPVATAALASSLIRHRAEFSTRAVVIAEGDLALRSGVRALADGLVPANVITGPGTSPGTVGVVFGGQGSQRTGTGRQLAERFPVFGNAFDAAVELLDRYLGTAVDLSVRDVAFGAPGTDGLIDRTVYTQSVVFAVEVALYRLWESWGVEVAAVAGHSIGGVVAAHVAGVLSLDDAARLVAARARLMDGLPSGGAMVAVEGTEAEVLAAIVAAAATGAAAHSVITTLAVDADAAIAAGIEVGSAAAVDSDRAVTDVGPDAVFADATAVTDGATVDPSAHDATAAVAVAAVNGPRAVVISGAEEAVLRVAAELSAAGRRVKRLAVSHAFHSAAMDPVLDEFRAVVSELTFSEVSGPRVVSDHTGREVTGAELADPSYWVRHLRGTVRFADAASTLATIGIGVVVELGADSVLAAALSSVLDGVTVVPALRRDRDEVTGVLTAAATVFTHGHPVDWTAIVPESGRVALPTYAFQRERYWIDTPGGATDQVPGEWIHRTGWERFIPTSATPGREPTWVLVTLDSGVTDEWARALRVALGTARVTELCVNPSTATRSVLEAGLAEVQGETLAVVSLLPLATRSTGSAFDLDLAAATAALTQSAAATARVSTFAVLTGAAVTSAEVDRVARAAGAGIVSDPSGAWHAGFIAAAATEGGLGRGTVIDVPVAPDDKAAELVVAALRNPSGEREFAIRGDQTWVKRVRGDTLRPTGRWRPTGTVLITGGTGALGAHVARRLARNGATDLLLVSRRGPEAPGAAELIAELSAAGAHPVIAACDVGDRDALADLIAGIPADRPLTDVVHTAAVLDDSLVESLDRERLERVHRAKVAAALHLHELTRDLELSSFVLFSSVTGVVPAPGQANYAPGNAVLDALAEHRRELGLPATAVAWGHWAGAGIAGSAAGQLRRGGLRAMSPAQALTALEYAVVGGAGDVIVADIDWAAGDPIHARLLAEVLPVADSSSAPEPAHEFAALDAAERHRRIHALVREETSAALGHVDSNAVDDDRGLRDQGFTSLSSVELRNRLRQRTGLDLPATLVFDHPTVTALTTFIAAELVPAQPPRLDILLGDLERVAAGLAAEDLSAAERTVALDRLRRLIDESSSGTAEPENTSALSESATDADLIDFIGSELGIS